MIARDEIELYAEEFIHLKNGSRCHFYCGGAIADYRGIGGNYIILVDPAYFKGDVIRSVIVPCLGIDGTHLQIYLRDNDELNPFFECLLSSVEHKEIDISVEGLTTQIGNVGIESVVD